MSSEEEIRTLLAREMWALLIQERCFMGPITLSDEKYCNHNFEWRQYPEATACDEGDDVYYIDKGCKLNKGELLAVFKDPLVTFIGDNEDVQEFLEDQDIATDKLEKVFSERLAADLWNKFQDVVHKEKTSRFLTEEQCIAIVADVLLHDETYKQLFETKTWWTNRIKHMIRRYDVLIILVALCIVILTALSTSLGAGSGATMIISK